MRPPYSSPIFTFSLRSLLIPVISLISFVNTLQSVWAHGGTPRVLAVTPYEHEIWMIDTLGAFRVQFSPSNQSGESQELLIEGSWQWLCDDAVDPQAGVDLASLLTDGTLIAIARSGVYRSEDLGCTFEHIGAPLDVHVISKISPHPVIGGEAVVFTQTLGQLNDVFLTTDSGRTWRAAGLSIEGGIYELWRSKENPERIWINHAQGLSYSADGGRTFTPLLFEVEGLTVTPNELKLLGGGPDLGEEPRLFMSVNRYPTSLLLTSNDGGSYWHTIHNVNDSYNSLIYSPPHLTFSTPFQGLFSYTLPSIDPMESLEGAELEERLWAEEWTQREDVFVDCLIADQGGRMWACGRNSPTSWLVAYTLDQGETWRVMMSSYTEAAGHKWECPAESSSTIACQMRCLDIDCDPTGLMSTQTEDQAGEDMEREGGARAGEMEGGRGGEQGGGQGGEQGGEDPASPPQPSGCQSQGITRAPQNINRIFSSPLSFSLSPLSSPIFYLIIILGGLHMRSRSRFGER